MKNNTVSKIKYAKTRMDYVCLIHSGEDTLKLILKKLYDGKYTEAEDIALLMYDNYRNLAKKTEDEI